MELKNFPDKKYDLIVVDPPWKYENQFKTFNNRDSTEDWPYKTVGLKEIYDLPIQSLSHDTSFVFLWTTQKYLFDSKAIIEKWGFNYICCMTWEKTFGVSSGVPMKGFRFCSEFIVVGSKHKVKPISPKGQPLIPCSFRAPNLGHSIKPQEFYKLIEHLGE